MTTLWRHWSPSSSSHKHHKQIASVWCGSIWIKNCSCQTTTQKGQPWSQPNENLSPSLESSISIKDPRKSCPDAAHKSSDFQLYHTQISICLPCWSHYINSSPSYCQWHSHSFWCQPSFCPDSPWLVGCFWHHWPLHTVVQYWTTFWYFWFGPQLVQVIRVKQVSVCFRKRQ